MNSFLDGILYSLSYFSTLPIKIKKFEANKSFYKGVVYGLPLTGLLLGVIIVGLYITLAFPMLYKAIFVSIIYLFLYGFIHLEALSDTIDGYFASLSNKDVYEVMKEPQIGAIGAIGTFCFIFLKVLALTFLLYYECFVCILLSLILSRASILFALELEFHKKSSFVLLLQDSFTPPLWFKLLLLPLSIFTKFILKSLKNRLGLLNGDTLGFTIELQELIYLNIGILLWL